MIILIAAAGLRYEIGVNNKLPWRIPSDLKMFKELTLNSDVIMGRKTYDSIGKPLPNRNNYVLTGRSHIDGVSVVSNLPSFIDKYKDNEEKDIYVIGGHSLYLQTIRDADKIILNKVNGVFLESDAGFPVFDRYSYTITAERNFTKKDKDDEYETKLYIYDRKKKRNHDKPSNWGF